MTFKLFTSISIAAMTTVFSITALAQGGDNPIPGIDIIIKEDPSQAPIKPFSMTGDEMAQLNRIKGVGRMELILKAASKRAKVDEGFMKSGMSVMGKDWCGECPWPETASYQFKSGKTTYKLDLKFHAENRSKYIGETGKNLAAPVKAQSPDGTASQPEQLKNGGGGNMMNILTFQKYNESVVNVNASGSAEQLLKSGVLTKKQASLLKAGQPHWKSLEVLARSLNLSDAQSSVLKTQAILQFDEADSLFSKRRVAAPADVTPDIGDTIKRVVRKDRKSKKK